MATSTAPSSVQSNGVRVIIEPSQVYSSIGMKLYLDAETADVHFIVGKQGAHCERVPAHKLQLITASEVFQTMFNGSWKEENVVRIVDATASSFKVFLKFFYMNAVELSINNVEEVMNLGKKYGVTGCTDSCVNFLQTILTSENVFWGYELAVLYVHVGLRKFCEKLIGSNAIDILNSYGFLQCDKAMVHVILTLDEMNCDESQVLSSCLSWAKASADQKGLDSKNTQILRDELGDLLYQIRFRSMPMKCFSMILASVNGLFTANELEEIFQLGFNKDFVSEKFNNKERIVASGTTGRQNRNAPDMIIFDRYWFKLNVRYHIRKVERVRFESIQPVLLVGFCCCRVFNTKPEIKTDLTSKITIMAFFTDGRVEEVFAGETKLTSGNEAYVELKEPIAMQKGNHYEIQLEQPTVVGYHYNEIGLKPRADLGDGLKVRVIGDINKPDFEGTKHGLVTKIFFKRI